MISGVQMRIASLLFTTIFCVPVFSQVKVPFDLVDNRVIVNSDLNNQGPFRMIFDTGSTLVVDVMHTSLLGLEPQFWFRAGGAGQGQVWAYLAEIEKVDLGPITLRNREVVGVPLGPIRQYLGFERLDGTFGKDLISDFVVKIDFEKSELELTESNEFSYQGEGVEVPYTLDGHYVVEVVVEGIPAKLWVDTGDRSSLTLFQSFVDEHNFLSGRFPIVDTVTGHGIGGPIPAKVANVSSMKIGSIEISDIPTRFPEHKYFPYDQVDGTIGTGLLKAWNLTFEEKRSVIIFENNSVSPQSFDRSGLWLRGVGNSIVAESVIAGSPAHEAGILVGDLVVGLDGDPVALDNLISLRDILSDKMRTAVKLTVKREEKQIEYTVLLRDLI